MAECQEDCCDGPTSPAAGCIRGSSGGSCWSVACTSFTPGVYALGHRALSRRAEFLAAVWWCGPSSALSHASAAAFKRWIKEDLEHVGVQGVSRCPAGFLDRAGNRAVMRREELRAAIDRRSANARAGTPSCGARSYGTRPNTAPASSNDCSRSAKPAAYRAAACRLPDRRDHRRPQRSTDPDAPAALTRTP